MSDNETLPGRCNGHPGPSRTATLDSHPVQLRRPAKCPDVEENPEGVNSTLESRSASSLDADASSTDASSSFVNTDSMYATGNWHINGRAVEGPVLSRVDTALHRDSSGVWDVGDAWPLDRPLGVAHINAALLPAGIEYWQASLQRYACPSRLRFQRAVVLTDWVDRRQVSRMGMPVEVGGRESVIQAASQCDVLLVSDPGSDPGRVCEWILEAKPPVTVFVAHGDGEYTRDRLQGIGPAIDHIVAVTRHVQREACAGWPVSVILNGVDPHRLVKTQPRHVSRQQIGVGPNDFVVGFVGRFSEEKNPMLIVDAVARLPSHYKALLVGHGAMREKLIQRCLSLLPGRFILTEGDGNLGDLYASMDAFVLPSRLEGYGLVSMEAMMCGVPVIGTSCGMIADLVTDHVDGLVIAPDATEIAKAIRKLGEHPLLRRAIARGGRRLANRCGYASQMARKYEQLLASLWLKAQRRSCADR